MTFPHIANSRLVVGTIAFLMVALHTVPSVTSVPDPDDPPPSAEEIADLMELSDWLVGDTVESGRPLSSTSPLRRAIRNHSRSFRLLRSFHGAEVERRVVDALPYGEIISETAARNRLDGLLIASMVEAESGFNAQALSPDGAVGLMQVLPSTAADLGVLDAREPAVNLDVGSRYFKSLLNEFGDDLELALAAYNAGPGNVLRYGGVPPFPETRNYVDRVLGTYVGHYGSIWSRSDTAAWLGLTTNSGRPAGQR